MNAKGAVTKNEVILEVKIPLVHQQLFEIFNILPVPTIKNNTLIAIKPDLLYFATDAHRDFFYLFNLISQWIEFLTGHCTNDYISYICS